MKKLVFVFCFLMIAMHGFAQDKIYTKLQKTPIDGEVTEIGVNDIKYKPADRPNLTIAIDKQDVMKIVYKNGQVNIITNPMQDMYYYQGQHMNNLKVSLLNVSTGSLMLYYERSLKPGKSYEYQLNIIGAGQDQKIGTTEQTMQQAGLGVGMGVKFIRMPDFINGSVRLRHLMQGSYVKPAVSVNVFDRNFLATDSFGYTGTTRKTCYALVPHVVFGKEWITDNSVSIDLYALIGYSFDNLYSNYTSSFSDGNNFSHYINQGLPFNGFGFMRAAKNDMGMVWGVGVKIGFLFDWKWMDKRAKKNWTTNAKK